jgi:2,3-bisphosphoglycerate-dependent phosphoglycerate mutase
MCPAADHHAHTPIPPTPSTPHAALDPPAPLPPESPLDRAFLTDVVGVGRMILVRHGQQRWPVGPNAAASEFVDPPLSETGRRQAEIVGRALAGEAVHAVYSSRLERAHQTGLEIARHHGMQPEVMDELREIEMFRDLPEGKRVRDLVPEPVLRGMQERFVQERSWDVYPYSESSAELRHRVVTVIEGIAALHAGETVVVACHGGVIVHSMLRWLDITPDHAAGLPWLNPTNSSLTEWHFRDDDLRPYELVRFNDAAHLAAADLLVASARRPG